MVQIVPDGDVLPIRARFGQKHVWNIGICKISGCSRDAKKSIAIFACRDERGQKQCVTSFVCEKCFKRIMDFFKKKEQKEYDNI